jgi:hypothetical protein
MMAHPGRTDASPSGAGALVVVLRDAWDSEKTQRRWDTGADPIRGETPCVFLCWL